MTELLNVWKDRKPLDGAEGMTKPSMEERGKEFEVSLLNQPLDDPPRENPAQRRKRFRVIKQELKEGKRDDPTKRNDPRVGSLCQSEAQGGNEEPTTT